MPTHGQTTHTRALTKKRMPVRTPARSLAATGGARGAADMGRYQCPPSLRALRGSKKPPCPAEQAGCRGRVGLGPTAGRHPPCLPGQALDADSGHSTSPFTCGARNLRYSPGVGARRPEVLVPLVGQAPWLWLVLTLQTPEHSVGHSRAKGGRDCMGTTCPSQLQGPKAGHPAGSGLTLMALGRQVPLLVPSPQVRIIVLKVLGKNLLEFCITLSCACPKCGF